MSEFENVTKKDVVIYTENKLNELAGVSETGTGKAMLARLRQGIGHTPGDLPLLWGVFFSDMPDKMFGRQEEPGYAEWAIYTALTLFALHQQGIHGRCMHKKGGYPGDSHQTEGQQENGETPEWDPGSLGSAMARLVNDEADRDRITRRFNIVAMSADMKALAYHLRGVVQMLRKDEITLDYAQLAGDIFQFQFPEGAEKVRLKWGRDFYRMINKNNGREDKDNDQ